MPRTGWEDKTQKEKLIHNIMHTTRMPVDVLIEDKERVAKLVNDSRKLCQYIKSEKEDKK